MKSVCPCRRNEEARGLKMIKLFSVKQKQKEDAQNNNGRPIKKQSAGELRVQKGASSSIVSSIPFLLSILRIPVSFIIDLGLLTLVCVFVINWF